jgi:hypothetical protein
MHHFELQNGTDNDNEEWIMCVQTAESYVEPTNDVGIEMALTLSTPNYIPSAICWHY